MKDINLKSLYTDRLDLRIPTMDEQYRLWDILRDEEVNRYYFPTPDRIFRNHDLSKTNIADLQTSRKIFMKDFTNWEIQEPFYKDKIKMIEEGEPSQKYTWSIFLRDTDTVIGQITCQPSENNPLDIRDVGWYIDPNYQGNGYASEAAEKVLDFMFNEVEISEVRTSAATINPGSWRIMEKMGFEFTGEKQSTYFKDDEILMSKCYQCNKEMFMNRKDYICKKANLEDISKAFDYYIEHDIVDADNWKKWKEEFINSYKEGNLLAYHGVLNGQTICEAYASTNQDDEKYKDLIDNKTVYLFAFRTIPEYQDKGYFSKLYKYMINDLKSKGYQKATLGVEPDEKKNKDIYFHYGFVDHIKDNTHTYPDGSKVKIEFYGKKL